MALGSTQSLKKMGTRNLPGSKGRLASRAHKLTAICGTVEKIGTLDVSQPYKPLRSAYRDSVILFAYYSPINNMHKYPIVTRRPHMVRMLTYKSINTHRT
jgi:hypothetical protein